MKCKQARKLIIDFLCEELSSEDTYGLQQHIAECADCLKYKEEMQKTIMYIKENETSTDIPILSDNITISERFPTRKARAYRWPIWVAAAVCACSILLFTFALLATEINYSDSTLTISFGAVSKQKKMNSELKTELLAEMNSMYQRTALILEEYQKGQVKFEGRIVQELRDYGNALSQTIKLLNSHESQRDKQINVALQQLQLRQNQMYDTIQRDLDALALETQREFERNYNAMATVTELVASGSY